VFCFLIVSIKNKVDGLVIDNYVDQILKSDFVLNGGHKSRATMNEIFSYFFAVSTVLKERCVFCNVSLLLVFVFGFRVK